MPFRTHPIWRSAAAWIVLIVLGLMIVASLLPLVHTDAWWIRFLDFPRVQFALALLILLVVYLLVARSRILRLLASAAGLTAFGYHAWSSIRTLKPPPRSWRSTTPRVRRGADWP